MASEDHIRLQVEELRARNTELTEELRSVTEERDAAYREIARLRTELAREETAAVDAGECGASRVELCAFCDGEGVYWVHDFEMQCKRCNGTGSVPKGAGSLAPERH